MTAQSSETASTRAGYSPALQLFWRGTRQTRIARFAPGQLVPAMLTLAGTPFLARALGPSEYGELAVATTAALIMAAVLFGWAEIVAVRELVVSGRDATWLVSDVSLLLVLSAGAALLLGVVLIGFGLSLELAVLIPALAVGLGLSFLASGAFRALDDAQGYALNLSVSSGGRYLLGVGAAVIGFGVDGVLGAWLAGCTLAVVVSARRLGVRYRSIGLSRLSPERTSFTLPLFAVAAGMTSLSLTDRLVIAVFLPAQEVGVYALGYSIVEQSLILVISVILAAYFPRVLAVYESEGPLAARLVSAHLFYLLLRATLGLGLVLVLFRRQIVRTVGGDGFSHAQLSFIVPVTVGVILLGLSQCAAAAFHQRRESRQWAAIVLGATAMNFIAAVVLVPVFGLIGAGVATVVGYATLAFASFALGGTRFMDLMRARDAAAIVVAASAAVVAWIATSGFPWPAAAICVLTAYEISLLLCRNVAEANP